MTATCEMIPRAWVNDDPCGKPAIGTHEGDVRVCADCTKGLIHEGFEIVIDEQTFARVGDRYRFVYENEPQFDRDLTVERVLGDGPDDLVFFNDHSHSKQKNLTNVITGSADRVFKLP